MNVNIAMTAREAAVLLPEFDARPGLLESLMGFPDSEQQAVWARFSRHIEAAVRKAAAALPLAE